MHRWAKPLTFAVLTVVALVATPARANDPALAEALFSEGQALMDAGKEEEACEKFAASMRADPSGGTALNLGLCASNKGQRATAWAHYKRAASLLAAVGDEEREGFAAKAAAELEPKLNRITVVAPAIEGLVVMRNGERVDPATFGTAVPVDPGTQEVKATAPGRTPWSTSVTLEAEGAATTVKIPELPSTDAAPDPTPEPAPQTPDDEGGSNGMVIGGIVMGAVGLVLVGVGAGLGGSVLADASGAEDDPTLCPNKMCTPAGREQIDAAETKALVSTILVPVGAAAVVGGVLMFLLAPGEETTGSISPLVGPGFWGVRGSF